MMDPASAIMVLGLVTRAAGVAIELRELARRVQEGETVTSGEIEAAEAKMNEARSRWDAAAEHDKGR